MHVKKKVMGNKNMESEEKLWDGLILINLFMAVFIYLPIFTPLEFYMEAHSFIFFIGLINLMVLSLLLQFKELSKSEKYSKEEFEGKVISFYRK